MSSGIVWCGVVGGCRVVVRELSGGGVRSAGDINASPTFPFVVVLPVASWDAGVSGGITCGAVVGLL